MQKYRINILFIFCCIQIIGSASAAQVEQVKRVPFYEQQSLIRELDSATLTSLGTALLEKKIKPELARTFLIEAATSADPAPEALFYCGHIVRAADQNYIPAMFACGIECLKGSLANLTDRQQLQVRELLNFLASHPKEQCIKVFELRDKAKHARCTIPDQKPDASLKKTIQQAYSWLTKLYDTTIDTPIRGMHQWHALAAYILGTLYQQQIGIQNAEDATQRQKNISLNHHTISSNLLAGN